jgi:endonuclease/exonuclease/phosphatase family metal-dependent hydrolase
MCSWRYKAAFNFMILLSIATALLLSSGTSPAVANPTVRVMTQNLYHGSEFDELVAARTPEEFVAAVTKAYQRILANKPGERMAAIAQEIARFNPDIVGLQEASILRTGEVSPATEVKFDMLQLLIAELAKLGQDYTIVGILPGPDFEAPTALGFLARLTVQDAMIARVNGDLKLSNLQVQRYLAQATVTSPVAGTIANPSGWISVDARTHGRSFRVVTTHLPFIADFNPTVPLANAQELVATAGNTRLPVVFIGDFNTPANLPSNSLHAIYANLINAGFTDAWTQVKPTDPGLTCCQAPDLSNPQSILSVRFDLAMLRGRIRAHNARLVGSLPSDRTAPSFLWPSDHAGLAVTLTLPR